MKQDERTGLWVPEGCESSAPNWPPRLRVYDDQKPPVRMDGMSKDRGALGNLWYPVELPKPHGGKG